MGPAGYTRGGRVDLLFVLRFIPIGVFDDATIRTIGRAFDACKELKDTGQPDVVHEVMIKRIVAAARKGERNVTRLRDAALTGLRKPSNEIRGQKGRHPGGGNAPTPSAASAPGLPRPPQEGDGMSPTHRTLPDCDPALPGVQSPHAASSPSSFLR